jgi:hypothetical protein
MKRKTLTSALGMFPVILLVSGTCAVAEDLRPGHFSGLINDYSPANVKGGPWEMHGQWAMDLHPEWRNGVTADFFADMTMSGFVTTSITNPDGTVAVVQTQAGVNPHTHHIRLTNVSVTWDMTGCPAFAPPVTTTGFQLNGTVSLVTGNGSNALFEPTPPTSTLQVCVTGGTEVTYSNVTLMFAGPATSHFGPQAIHGVVRKLDGSIGNRAVPR